VALGLWKKPLLVRNQPLPPRQHLSARIVLARISRQDRASSTGGSLWSCAKPTRARLLEFGGAAAGVSLRFPLVIFMLVKKASDLLLQLRGPARLAHGNGVFEKLPLDRSRQIIPLQEHRRPKAPQDTLLFL
jgi:hypothetical protein